MKSVLVNVGISGGHRGIIFPDRSFVFVPLNSASGKCKLMPLYENLQMTDFTHSKYQDRFENFSLADLLPSLHGKRAHNDPDFQHRTYGHAKRGFGYETLLRSLTKKDILLFYATLDYKGVDGEKKERLINPVWGTYIVGAFSIEGVYGNDEFDELSMKKQQRFRNNPHYYCKTGAHIWIAGRKKEHGLFRKAVPIGSPKDNMTCLPLVSRNFRTSGGKPAGSTGWYRAALECKKNSESVWKKIKQQYE